VSGWRFRPALSGSLLVLWLLLANSVALGQVLIGGLLAVLIPRWVEPFWPARPRTCHALRLLRFTGLVLADIVRANVSVARLILGRSGALRPAFVEVPLDLTDDLAIAVLASTISLTPGTVSATVSADRRTLLVHGLDVADSAALAVELKQRYEAPIKEILECST
jgi:multicomponent K+:H+ antiporter subunit E